MPTIWSSWWSTRPFNIKTIFHSVLTCFSVPRSLDGSTDYKPQFILSLLSQSPLIYPGLCSHLLKCYLAILDTQGAPWATKHFHQITAVNHCFDLLEGTSRTASLMGDLFLILSCCATAFVFGLSTLVPHHAFRILDSPRDRSTSLCKI